MFSCAMPGREVKNISEKKTDEADAEWLMLLHSYGLLKPSFQPENTARQVRNLARHRSNLLRSAGKEVQHMQKANSYYLISWGGQSDGKGNTITITIIDKKEYWKTIPSETISAICGITWIWK